ncbi:hypothetical protein TNCV_5141641 [Trichonephila clavipes]|nr:hypothetical protein TNCV_5141641 [Trichonephila clavipes]
MGRKILNLSEEECQKESCKKKKKKAVEPQVVLLGWWKGKRVGRPLVTPGVFFLRIGEEPSQIILKLDCAQSYGKRQAYY